MNIIDYKVVAVGALAHKKGEQLTVEVLEQIKDGWQPLGGVASHGRGLILYQAMVKYEQRYTATIRGRGYNEVR